MLRFRIVSVHGGDRRSRGREMLNAGPMTPSQRALVLALPLSLALSGCAASEWAAPSRARIVTGESPSEKPTSAVMLLAQQRAPRECSRDNDCVLVGGRGGFLCGECGSCPGDPGVAISRRALANCRARAARLVRGPPARPAPRCPPCAGPPPVAQQVSVVARCAAGRCVTATRPLPVGVLAAAGADSAP